MEKGGAAKQIPPVPSSSLKSDTDTANPHTAASWLQSTESPEMTREITVNPSEMFPLQHNETLSA